MNVLGQLSLFFAFVGSGYAAFACMVGRQPDRRRIGRSGDAAGVVSVLALTTVTVVLARALLVKDFHFAYVAEYSSRRLPWHYSLSALWVGQAGSLLVWAWFLGVLGLVYRFWPHRKRSELREHVFGMMMAYLSFLVAVMVFGADPMEPSLGSPREGAGLSPLLQHPAMLIHPPIVLLGYAGWTVPFALAVAALVRGKLDVEWVREARGWALFAWAVLGGGILWGALWAYEELGWGGYWSWDPVENGSLIPWLTGAALLHTLMAWQYRGVFKKTTVSLAIATFALCNFATFLTRSGVFSSLHAFSQSSIGWMFLLLLVALAVGGGMLVAARRSELSPDRPVSSIWAREASVLIATMALLLLAMATLAGTAAAPLSKAILGRAVAIGPPFYNNVLIPTGLLLLAGTAVAPILCWGHPPTRNRRRLLLPCMGAGAVAAVVAFCLGVRHPIALAVTSLAVLAVAGVTGALILDIVRRGSSQPGLGLARSLRDARRQYAGSLIHLGFVLLAVGVTGSSLGTRRHEVVMSQGQTIEWAGRSIRLVEWTERGLPDKLVAEATLDISRGPGAVQTLLPAQHLHLPQEEWTTEVAIHSTWGGDLYAILHGRTEEGSVRLTLIDNPLMRFIWFGGWVMGAGTVLGVWPAGRRSSSGSAGSPPSATRTSGRSVPAPHRKRRAAQHNRVSG